MVGSNWSCEELDALLRAWRDALDAAPHTKSFRLLEFIMQRFAVRCGKNPSRSAGSVEIKRKYMKNMVRVITQFNERSGSKKTWFALPPRERKQWFLLFNAKSYKFANMSEECYRTVKELMEIEEVVLYASTAADGSTTRAFHDEEDAKEEDDGSDDNSDASAHQYVSDIRVSLVRRKDGSWMTRPAESSTHYSVPHETTLRKNDASRRHTVFDQLVSAASGARDVVMIDAASDGEDGDESDTSSSGNDHEYDDDDGHDRDLLGDLTPSRLPLHLRRQDSRIDHCLASPRALLPARHYVSANSERDVPNASRTHSRPSTGVLHALYSNQRTNADLQQVVSDLGRQAQQAKELLDHLRDERNQGQTERDRGQQMQKCKDGDVKWILDQIQAREDELCAVREQQKVEYEEQKKILLQLKVAREAKQQDNEVKKRDQEERRQLMELIHLDREEREKFRQERKREMQEQSRFFNLIREDQDQRRQDANERRAFLEQLKRHREALPLKADDEKMQESTVEERSSEPDEQDGGFDALVNTDETRSKQSDAADEGPKKTSDDPEVVGKIPETASGEPEAAKAYETTNDMPVAAKVLPEVPKVQRNQASAEGPKELKETKEPEEIKAPTAPTRRATRQSILRDQTLTAPMASRTRSKQTKKAVR